MNPGLVAVLARASIGCRFAQRAPALQRKRRWPPGARNLRRGRRRVCLGHAGLVDRIRLIRKTGYLTAGLELENKSLPQPWPVPDPRALIAQLPPAAPSHHEAPAAKSTLGRCVKGIHWGLVAEIPFLSCLPLKGSAHPPAALVFFFLVPIPSLYVAHTHSHQHTAAQSHSLSEYHIH